MQQPKRIKDLIKVQSTLPTANYASSQSDLCSVSQQRGMLVRQRFGKEQDFLQKVNPDARYYFGVNVRVAVMGDYPTLNDINMAYGNGFATEWLIPLIDVLSLETAANNTKERQQLELARIIATEYRHFKITEILLFFYRFKAGFYGRFYGSVDPMVIMCALRDFAKERADLINKYQQEENDRLDMERKKNSRPISYEEYLQIKQKKDK